MVVIAFVKYSNFRVSKKIATQLKFAVTVTILASSSCELSFATYIALVAFQNIHFLQQLQLSLLIKFYMTPSLNSQVTAAATTMAAAVFM